MKPIQQWMADYGVSHTHPTNILIHKVCVPAIMFSVFGLFWEIPRPTAFPPPWVNWSTLFAATVMVYYLVLSWKMFVGMLLQTVAMFAIIFLLEKNSLPVLWISIAIFVVAWVFQFIGHKIEGKKPSFMQDLAFLLIGPLWVTKSLYKKLGIKVP